MIHKLIIFVVSFSLVGCIVDSKVKVNLTPSKESSVVVNPASVTSVKVINDQLIISGSHLENITDVKIGGTSINNFHIESKSGGQIIANSIQALSLDISKAFNLILSDAHASATFPIDFSICDATLNGKTIDCSVPPSEKDVLSYDSNSNTWKPRSVNGFTYQGSWDSSSSFPSASASGDYFIVSTAHAAYSVGDWIVWNGSSFDHIINVNYVTNVFGRAGAITANKGDYSLTKMGDVDLTTIAPVANQILKYDGTNWIPADIASLSESDPTVMAYAKSALPTCSSGQVLKSDGTNFSCVTDALGTFSGTANRIVSTNGSGLLSVTSISDTVFNYLSGVTSNIQTQIDSKLDWATSGVATIHPSRLNLTVANAGKAVITDGSGFLTVSPTTSTQLGYLSTVTSNVQTQLNSKISTETDPSVSAFAKSTLPTCNTGEVLKSNGSAFSCVTDNSGAGAYAGGNNFVVVTDGAGALSDSTISTTKLGYLNGVSSDIQTQINSKQSTISKSTIQDVSKLRIYGANTTNYVELTTGTLTANRTLSFPDSNGTNGYALTTNGSGVLSWTSIATSSAVTSVNTLTGAVSLTTTNIGEGTNLYHTDARTLATPITSPTLTNSAIATSDTIQVSLGKLQAQLNGVLAKTLTSLSTATNSAITSADSILIAFGKLQAQINGHTTTLNTKADVTNTTQTITALGVTGLAAPSAGSDAANKTYVDGSISSNGIWNKGTSNSINYTSGYVGIGTTTPSGGLEIVNNNVANSADDLVITTYSNTHTPAFSTKRSGGTLAAPTVATANMGLGVLQTNAYNGTNYSIATEIWGSAENLFVTGDTSTFNSYISFKTMSAGARDEKVRISSTGRLGIGTSTPLAPLHVNEPSTGANVFVSSETSFAQYVLAASTTGTERKWAIKANDTDGAFAINEDATASNNRFTILEGGNIGIGASSPTGRLEVKANAAGGLIKASTNGTMAGELQIESTTAGNHLFSVTQTSSEPIISAKNQSGVTRFYVGGTTVGIGTGSPGATLDVNGTTKLGTAGTAFASMGACTIASTAITTTAADYTCTGVPASTLVAVNCSSGAAMTSPGTNSVNCRAKGVLNTVTCNTSLLNSVATTWTCMWIRP